ncbi:MAG: endonuclease MutS2 [Synergistaceae bacterium]|nr:endonuclease MutS2 [Synergistaceae bacterium]
MELSEGIRRILEIPKVVGVFAACVRGDLGKSALERLKPQSSLRGLLDRLELFDSFMEFQDRGGEWPWNPKVALVGELLEGAKRSGMLSGPELVSVRSLLSLAGATREALGKNREDFPSFEAPYRRIRDFSSEVRALGVLDDNGELFDTASPELAAIRRDVEHLRTRLRRAAQSLLETSSISQMLQDRVVAYRNGRFSFLVRQECVNRFPGTVVDRSGSGSSVYMEPTELAPLDNALAVRLRDQEDEERKILRNLTEAVLSRERPIADAQDILCDLDLLYGASEVIAKHGWKLPRIEERPLFSLHEARHPLLGESAVPVSVRCGEGFRSLVITGPNTGGKTVVLKTVGVCVFLAWCGLPIPVEDGSRVGNIGALFVDIGDEQSMEQNLSTFSAHLKNIISILDRADRTSLVLLDELGAGTDPQEGAALGVALLETLTREKGLTLATTHHNPIKQYALTAPGVETASMEFDSDTLSPTYKLLMGVPGKSNALLIASRYGMPEAVLEKARKALSERETPVEELIGELNERKAWLDRQEREMRTLRVDLEREKKKYRHAIRETEAERDKMISEAEKKADEILARAEESSRELIRKLDEASRSGAHRATADTSERIRKERKAIEDRQEKRLLKGRDHSGDQPLKVGSAAQIAGTDYVGIIEKLHGGKAILRVGAIKMDVDARKLMRTEKMPKGPPLPREHVSRAPRAVGSSILVRGMNVQEALPLVERYLDQAMRCGYSSVLVIHGRGEGILRREIHALCASLKYVDSYRLGEMGEGGHGVTVVSFRR